MSLISSLVGSRNLFVRTSCAVDSIFEFETRLDAFVRANVMAIYRKLLTDCVKRTEGIDDKNMHAVFDNCAGSESNKGLISYLAEAMACQADLFLVYKEGVLRRADSNEQEKIRKEYKENTKSKSGAFITFRNLEMSDQLKVYACLEYAILCNLHKSLNLAKAVQYKFSEIRKSVSLMDKDEVLNQAKDLAEALRAGKDVSLDKEDEITTAKIDMGPTKEATLFLDTKRAFALNMPLSWITGEQTPGIGSSGEQDTRAVDFGLSHYHISIVKPSFKEVFQDDVSFKSHDFRMFKTGFEAIKTFSLGATNNYISIQNQRLIVSKLFDVKNDMEGQPDLLEASTDADEDEVEDEDKNIDLPDNDDELD